MHSADSIGSRAGPPSSGPDVDTGLVLAGQPASLSPDQREAGAAIKDFLAHDTRRVFSLHGLAGTGKSFLLARIAKAPLDRIVCAPTGKAASLLRHRFGVPAQTIHSVFYRLKAETQRSDGRRDLQFEPRRRVGSLAGRVLLVDESSMVTDQLRDQLLATGVRIVAFGDPGQLPPVTSEPGFPHADFALRTIHRQAAGSRIITQAHRVRGGLDYQSDGDAFRVVRKGTADDARRADVVLCWRNSTRHFLNQHCRFLRGVLPVRARRDGLFDPQSAFPRQFEPVVVLRNSPRHNVWNGDIETLDQDVRPDDRTVSFFRVSESGDSAGGVEFPLQSFAGMPGTGGVSGGLELDFGYVMTVHKSQGSEWPFVVLVDEFPHNDPERSRWLYTGITRASERIVIVNRHYR